MTDAEYQAVVERVARGMFPAFWTSPLREAERKDSVARTERALSALGLRELVEAVEDIDNIICQKKAGAIVRIQRTARTALTRLKQGAGDAPVTEGERS